MGMTKDTREVVDSYGNVGCPTCGKGYSPSFPICPRCCSHPTLDFTEGWHGNDESGGWESEVVCSVCGADQELAGLNRDVLQSKYRVVLK